MYTASVHVPCAIAVGPPWDLCVIIAAVAAANYRKLRGHGVAVRKTIDVIIGTFCLLRGHELLHADRDFDPMENHLGLCVVGTELMVNGPA
jgi:predicted nucleic acid-binding protein